LPRDGPISEFARHNRIISWSTPCRALSSYSAPPVGHMTQPSRLLAGAPCRMGSAVGGRGRRELGHAAVRRCRPPAPWDRRCRSVRLKANQWKKNDEQIDARQGLRVRPPVTRAEAQSHRSIHRSLEKPEIDLQSKLIDMRPQKSPPIN
jgi:hypothetical protein